MVDGFPTKTLSAKWLLNNITVVEQQSVLFNTSIKENIALGNEVYGTPLQEMQLKTSIDFALLQTIIDASAKGVDSNVGPGGSRLSGGQRQRLALARARVRDTPILILDESLSALDPRSRNIILKNIRQWRAGKTTIIITHELSQIREDDYVYILKKGKTTKHGFKKDISSSKIFQNEIKRTSLILSHGDSQSQSSHSPFSDYYQNSNHSKHDTIHFPVNTPTSPRNPSSSVSPFKNYNQFRRPASSYLASTSPLSSNIPNADGREDEWNGKSSNLQSTTATNFSSEVTENKSQPLRYSVRPLSAFYPSIQMLDQDEINNNMRNSQAFSRIMRPRTELLRPFSAPSPLSPLELQHQIELEEHIDESLRLGAQAGVPLEKLGFISYNDAKKLPIPTIYILKKCYHQITSKPLLFVGVGAAIVNGGINPIFSYAISRMFSAMFPGQASQADENYKWIILAVCIAVIDAITIYLRTHVLCMVADMWVRHVRIICFESVLNRDISWFVDNSIDTGELTSLIMNETEDIRVICTTFLIVISTSISLSLICFLWVMILGWKLCLVSFALIPGSYLSYLLLKFFGNYFDGKCTSLAAQVDEVIHEMVSGIRTLRILGIERYFINRFEKLSAQYALVKIKDSFSKGFGFGISELFPFLSQGVLLYYGMQLVADGDYSVTEVMLIFTILLFSITSISVLITAIPQMQKPLVIMVRILHLLDYDPSKSREAQGAKIKMGLTGSSISFKNVNFSYSMPREIDPDDLEDKRVITGREAISRAFEEKDTAQSYISVIGSQSSGSVESLDPEKTFLFGRLVHKFSFLKRHSKKAQLDRVLDERASAYRIISVPVLHDFTTDIPSNSVVAIVGPSGSGKSTLTSLLTKLYEPTSGSLTVGGIDIRDIDTDSLRSEIAVVGQMPLHFFRGTIRENLLFGIPRQVSEAEVRQVCDECSVDEFISALPEKYETIMGGSTGSVSSGATSLMSGGQMQRIGLARALLRKPRILILDECTSGLDHISTNAILSRLKEYKKLGTMTIIVITHQEATAQIADIVISIADGRVVKREIRG